LCNNFPTIVFYPVAGEEKFPPQKDNSTGMWYNEVMAKIKRLTWRDMPKIKKMFHYDGEKFPANFVPVGLMVLQRFIPLRWKILPETFVLVDEKKIMGFITIIPTAGNPYKINITRLIFRHSEAGKQLVEYIIPKYGAKGAVSFNVAVDVPHDELLDLFVSGCGFRQCSCEELWKLEEIEDAGVRGEELGVRTNFPFIKPFAISTPQPFNLQPFRPALNSDLQQVCELYNSELISHFRPSLEKTKGEFSEPVFAGLTNSYKNSYVLEQDDKLICYLSITTSDNINYIVDISKCEGYELSYDEVIDFALNEISRRKTGFSPIIKLRKYTRDAENFENYLKHKKAERIQTQHILVKDFYKPVKQSENPFQVFLFGENRILSS
jgi:hypothetical protein